MGRSSLAALGVAIVLAGALGVRMSCTAVPVAAPASASAPAPALAPALASAPASATTSTSTSTSTTAAAPALANEAALMDRLRAAEPVAALALVRQGNEMYPHSPYTEEREARGIDALVALGDIGEAHSQAMLFVQHHPTGPFTAHVMNLMGVHPRPPGAVPEPGAAALQGR